MWMLPLYLHVNQKSDYDGDDDDCGGEGGGGGNKVMFKKISQNFIKSLLKFFALSHRF